MGQPRKHPRAKAVARPHSRGSVLIASALLLALAVIAWTAWRRYGGVEVRREPGLSVLLITVDTLRADALGAYGRARARTPWIDRLARGGVRFARARAHNVVTLPSHANLLSGRLPLAHGIRDNSGFRFPGALPTLATLLKANGYRTGAFVSAFVLDSRFGLDLGFDVYDDHIGGEARLAFLVPERRGTETVAAAVRWLAEAGSAPRFAFVHLYEPHFPYDPPEPFASEFRDEPYHGEVAAADAALEPLLRPILDAGRDGRTLVIVTADHGEGLGEHAEETHGVFAYESTLHVPLILYAPRLFDPRVVEPPVDHVDLLPTLLEALGLEAPPGLDGRSLLPLAAGHSLPSRPSYFEALSASLNRGWAPLRGLLDGNLKHVDLPIPELYDLASDPGETRNLAGQRPLELDVLRDRLALLRAADRGPQPVREDSETQARLRALGYLAGGNAPAKQRYDEADDPKRLIELDRMDAQILELYRTGQLEAAIALCRRSLAERPDMLVTLMQLAYLERAQGDLAAAIEAARRAFSLRPTDEGTLSLLANYLVEAGRSREALTLLEPFAAADAPDPDVLTAQGMALAHLGRRGEALAAFERARRQDPTNAIVLVNAGTVHLMAGERPQARRAFEAALELDAHLARAHNGLGVIAAQEGHVEEALTRWSRAVDLNPRDYQTLFNLGVTLRRLGREAEARPYFEAYLREAPRALESPDLARVRIWLGRGS